MGFFKTFIRSLLDEGDVVDIATNECDGQCMVQSYYRDWGCIVYHIDTSRSPFSTGNLRAVKQIREIVEKGQYDLVHCHTPLASVAARQACKRLRKSRGLKVFYTAHGFHFYDGAPLKNWLIFYPIEKHYSRYTDVLITINKEDYRRAKNHFKAKKVVYIPGVGVDTEKFSICNVDKSAKRAELGMKDSDFLLLSVGELSERKNQKVVIEALHKMKTEGSIDNIVYLAVGKGDQEEEFSQLIQEYELQDHIKLLGFRTDIDELCEIVDCFVHPSIREGLGIAPLEAMAAGLPLISAAVNGIKDYTEDGVSGCCVDPTDTNAMIAAIKRMHDDKSFRTSCASNNFKTAKTFDIRCSAEIMSEVYRGGIGTS